jgi:hypothetical protein
MIKDSPWGAVQDQDSYCPGVTRVSTAGHGGIAVAEGIAHKHLSEEARRRAGFHHSGYYWYEEDCDWAIPIYELPVLWPKVARNDNIEQLKRALFLTLSLWNADYLLERGIEPEPDNYAEYLKMQKQWEGRRA